MRGRHLQRPVPHDITVVNVVFEVIDVHALAMTGAVASEVESHNLDIFGKKSGDQVVDIASTVLSKAVNKQQSRNRWGGCWMHPNGNVFDVQMADVAAGLHFQVEKRANAAVRKQRWHLADGGEEGVKLWTARGDDVAGIEERFWGEQGQVGAGCVRSQRAG